jgi:hypothetical protein
MYLAYIRFISSIDDAISFGRLPVPKYIADSERITYKSTHWQSQTN